MKNSFAAIGLLVLCFVAMSCFFSTSSTTVKGRVVEYGDKPVPGAEITLGGPISPSRTTTGADGRFTITASHRATQVLTLTVKKEGFAGYEDKFPGFAAPDGEKRIELMHLIYPSK